MKMPPSDLDRARFHHTLDELVKRGWLSGWSRIGDRYDVAWTPLGEKRRGWMRTIEAELGCDERSFTEVRAACLIGAQEGEYSRPV